MVQAVVPSAEFEKLFTDNIQDMLMVSYLSNLTKAQLALTEKMSVMGLTQRGSRRRGGGGHRDGDFGAGGDRQQTAGDSAPPKPLRDAIQ